MPEYELDPAAIEAIFKAYDIRGLVPSQLDEPTARAIGNAFVAVLEVEQVVVGHDMRPSSPGLAAAFADGAQLAGADVVMIGLASTDMLYYASGRMGMAGAMFTASHNPAGYNGIKLCGPGAQPIGQDTGLGQLKEQVLSGQFQHGSTPGVVSEAEVLHDYAAHLRGLVPGLEAIRPLSVVVDAGNGMAGLTAPAIFSELGLTVYELFFELDGTFPNHEANPIEPANLRDLQAKVREVGADIGLAFDGDADRCFVIDENGDAVDPSTLTGLIAVRELAREPGATIIHNLITSRAVPELIAEHGGTAVRTRVGHSFIKERMAQTNAVFGGEHSGHFYFREFWRADSGALAALHAIAALGETTQPLSQVLQPYQRYAASGEINSTVTDQNRTMEHIKAAFTTDPTVNIDELDGVTVTAPEWWFNVRASNTEPLLRLNCEGVDRATMEQVRDRVLALIRD